MSIYISAAHKSSGKTTISLGLCAAFSQSGLAVQSFKKGPDYIDPIWLSRATKRPCLNLDFYTSSESEILNTFDHYGFDSDVRLIEGNKGLFDGVSLDGSDSNAAMSKLLKSPVVLVIDTQGMTRGIAPLLQGYESFDKNVDLAGVILNQVGGERHEAKLIESISEYTDLKVYGAVRKLHSGNIVERHLGLVPANEDDHADAKIHQLSEAIAQQVDLESLISLGKGGQNLQTGHSVTRKTSQDISIAIAQDAAFGFYYQDDIDAFKILGVNLIPFSPIHDRKLPKVDGLFLGGGFPERHMLALEENHSMRESIRQAIEHGMPSYAECGGLMYLSREIQWDSKHAKGVGVIPAKTMMEPRPQGRGYMELKETGLSPWPILDSVSPSVEPVIKAHEFHYSSLEGLPDSTVYAYDVKRGKGITHQKDGIIYKNLLANYAHLRDKHQNHWVSRFVAFIRSIK